MIELTAIPLPAKIEFPCKKCGQPMWAPVLDWYQQKRECPACGGFHDVRTAIEDGKIKLFVYSS